MEAEKNVTILWVDDEIDLLKAHIMFLKGKGYHVISANNGADAIAMVAENNLDLIFLDENMPGKSGLETLSEIKTMKPSLPVVMITKSEEEDIMDQAIGSKIADYLIKPVNPKQILLTIKKNIDTKRLVNQTTTSAYQTAFSELGLKINSARDYKDWQEVYKQLVYWELELERSGDSGMGEVLQMQKADANRDFGKYIKSNYLNWFKNQDDGPLLSPNILRKKVFPLVDAGEKVIVILIDNLRFDQWKTLQPFISEYLVPIREEFTCSILPTATQYARNAFFAGLMPLEIEKLFPDLWVSDEDEEMKNLYEEELLNHQISRLGKKYKTFYHKVTNVKSGKKVSENVQDLMNYDLSVLVYNFVDMLSHARTDMEMIRELASDESAYRSITRSWFNHSHLLELIKELSTRNLKVVITTDHGTVNVNNPVKVIGDRKTSTNLRYKLGKNLNYNPKHVYDIRKPEEAHLPSSNVTSTYIFATEYDFFVYPNNYNYYSNYYRHTFQHGGISLEEMLIPLVVLEPRG